MSRTRSSTVDQSGSALTPQRELVSQRSKARLRDPRGPRQRVESSTMRDEEWKRSGRARLAAPLRSVAGLLGMLAQDGDPSGDGVERVAERVGQALAIVFGRAAQNVEIGLERAESADDQVGSRRHRAVSCPRARRRCPVAACDIRSRMARRAGKLPGREARNPLAEESLRWHPGRRGATDVPACLLLISAKSQAR